MRAPSPWSTTLGAAIVALAVWRAVCIWAGPDIDTDSYAHHMIARAILADPRDLGVHWVWLPLFHYAQVPLVWLGGTMNQVRAANVALSAAVPAVLFGYVRRTARSTDAAILPAATALLAALFAAVCPIAMQMGTTAQPEPLFALLVLGVAIAFERGWAGATAALLGAAVLLRYEAWAVLVAIAAWLAVEGAWRRLKGIAPEPGRSSGWAAVVVPVLLIVGWAALRRPVDGQWFGFLRQTREFANGALHEESALGRGLLPLLRDLFYYPVLVAFRVLGPVPLLAPFGVARTLRQQGPRFVLVFVACLGFVSLSWILRSSLGLDRHFVAVVPLYATFSAQGVAAAADWGARVATRLGSREADRARFGRGLGAILAVVLLGALAVETRVWMGFWRDSIARGWPDRAALGAYLRTLPPSSTIFCDDATLEILSGLDRRRFDRHWVDDPQTWELIEASARAPGGTGTYVATWKRKLRDHEASGEIVFRATLGPAGAGPAPDGDEGVAVMRVAGDGARSQR